MLLDELTDDVADCGSDISNEHEAYVCLEFSVVQEIVPDELTDDDDDDDDGWSDADDEYWAYIVRECERWASNVVDELMVALFTNSAGDDWIVRRDLLKGADDAAYEAYLDALLAHARTQEEARAAAEGAAISTVAARIPRPAPGLRRPTPAARRRRSARRRAPAKARAPADDGSPSPELAPGVFSRAPRGVRPRSSGITRAA